MGKFIYDGNISTDFEDRLLAHLQAVITAKVRRQESFVFTWKDDLGTGGGRTSVYIHPGVSLVFKFHGSRAPQMSTGWLQASTYTANSPRGLYVVPEPETMQTSTDMRTPMTFREVRADDPATS